MTIKLVWGFNFDIGENILFIRPCAMVLNGGVESKVQHLDAMQRCVELEERGVEFVQLCWILPCRPVTAVWQILIGCLDFSHFNNLN